MKKFWMACFVVIAVLISMPAALAAEDIQIDGCYEVVDTAQMSGVSLLNNVGWAADWTCYGDQLTGDARTIYQTLETALKEDSIVPGYENINGMPTLCWEISTTHTCDYTNGIDFNTKYYQWVEGKEDAAALACQAFSYDHPEYFWLRQNYMYGYSAKGENGKATFTLIAGYIAQPSCNSIEKRNALQAELTPVIEKLLSDTESMSTVERLAYFDNWLAEKNHYNSKAANRPDQYLREDDIPWSIAGALLDDYSPVCEGYSKAFQLLCHEIGVPCLEISGRANGGRHMWTAVQLNGEWYLCDPTWDDPSFLGEGDHDNSSRSHFLTSQPATHVIDMDLLTPEITNDDYFEAWNLNSKSLAGGETGEGDMLIALYDEYGKMLVCDFCPSFYWTEGSAEMYIAPEFDVDLLKKAAKAVRFNFYEGLWEPCGSALDIG